MPSQAEVQLDYKMDEDEVNNAVAFLEALKGEVPEQYQSSLLAANELEPMEE